MSALSFKLTPGSLHMPLQGHSLSAETILEDLAARADAFAARGMRPDDRVFIGHGNCPNFFLDLLACWSLGACVIPLDPQLTSFEVGNLLRAARPTFLLEAAEFSAAHMPVLKEESITVIDTGPDAAFRAHGTSESRFLERLNAAQGDALILFTSGSTGKPKGVVHTHETLRAKWRALSQVIAPDSLRRSLCLLPTHFGHGLICNALFPWLSGNDLFLLPPFSPQSLLGLGDLLDRHAITFFSSVPAVWQLALKGQPPSGAHLREVFCGSAPLSKDLWQKVANWCGGANVRNVYGITETGSWIAGARGDAAPADGLVGTPWGSRFAIMPGGSVEHCPQRGAPCEDGEPGHVWVKTDALMKGYLDREDLTAQQVCEGWFSTGDIGLIDAEGQLILKGRERDEINRGGIKIYPADVEAVVATSPQVREACAFACDDPLYGQAVAVAVVPEPDCAIDLKALYAWASEHLAEYKIPKNWYMLDSIPKTDRGKINRDTVARRCAELPPADMTQSVEGVM